MKQQQKGKNVQIDMSTLSETQKKMCVQLLAHSNIQFQQRNNEFVAQIKIDPTQLSQPPLVQKPKVEPKRQVMSPSKKALSRTVKIGELHKLQSLHSKIQIYIYPKRLSGTSLCETIQNIYEKFWAQNKKKSTQIRSISLPQWVYRQIILPRGDRLKIQQFLVNLIDSLNHFQNKIPGLKIFYSFLAQKLPVDALFYFLVLRGLLEQVIGQRILEKNNQNQSASGVSFLKMKFNPYERTVSEQEMLTFLKVLFSGGLSCSRSKAKSFEQVHQGLTVHMFFDEQRKKNYIYFFDLLEQLISEFMDYQASSCDMSLSKTNLDEPISLTELISDQIDEPLFAKPANLAPPPSNYVLELQPAEQQKALQRRKQQESMTDKDLLQKAVLQRVEDMYTKLKTQPSQNTLNAIDAAIQTVSQLDKGIWLRFRNESISESELFSIQRLQSMFRQGQGGFRVQAVIQPMVKGILLIPLLRELICQDLYV